MAEVINGVWIGPEDLCTNDQWLMGTGIVLVVDCRDVQRPTTSLTTVQVHRCSMRDEDRPVTNEWVVAKLTKRLDSAAQIIQTTVASGQPVLVHCVSGINRSALVIAWWLMCHAELKRTYHEAMALLEAANQTRDKPTLINIAFRDFLFAHAK